MTFYDFSPALICTDTQSSRPSDFLPQANLAVTSPPFKHRQIRKNMSAVH